MRRIGITGLCLAALCGLSLVATAAASAEGPDWTINGVPLKTGRSAKIKVESLTTTRITASEIGVAITCTKMSGSGTIVGGEVGTGMLKMKLTGCSIDAEAQCKVKPKLVTLPTGVDWILPNGHWIYTWHQRFPVGSEFIVKGRGCLAEGTYKVEGLADSEGTTEEVVAFPEAPLPESTLTLDGFPAVLEGTDRLKLTKGGTLGTGEL
jgi:hypothetical protein